MGNIVDDIIEEIDVKPNKTKKLLRWVISISITLIGIAFVFGQLKASYFNKIDNIDKSILKNKVSIEVMKKQINIGFINVDKKVDNVFDTELIMFNDFQIYNNKQLGLIIKYGNTNKELLKEMLEINTLEKKRDIENLINTAKIKNVEIDEEFKSIIDNN